MVVLRLLYHHGGYLKHRRRAFAISARMTMTPFQSSTRNTEDILKIKVSKIQAANVPVVGWRTGRFFVEVKVDGGAEKTEIVIAESGLVLWDDEFHFDIFQTSTITITLLATHRVRVDTIVGWSEEKINASLWSSKSIERRLRNETGTLKTLVHLQLELLPREALCAAERQAAYNARTTSGEVHDFMSGMQIALGAGICPANPLGAEMQARHAAWGDGERASTIPAAEILGLGAIDSVSETWDLLLKHVDMFTNIVERFSEIHPYVKFACSVLTMTQKVVLAQRDRDDRFRGLIKITSESFCFLNELKVAALEAHRPTIKTLALQTTECAYFIRDYTKQKSFIIRAATNTISGAAMEGKIAQYEKKFHELKVAFRDGAALTTEITVLRIAEQVDRIATAGELDDLPYAPGARFDLGKQCLSGTRLDLLDKIYEWVNKGDVDTPRVLMLIGGAGSGKSAIAHTVANRFNELKRLAHPSSFSANIATAGPTNSLVPSPVIWPIWIVIGPRAVRKTSSVLEQFEEFILKPARRSLYFGPVVIVIDALDASGNQPARQALISLLSSRTTELPSNFRILVTTRPEPDITEAFSKCKDVASWDLEDVLDKQSKLDDVAVFFSSELSGVAGWNDRVRRKLTTKSDGDFGWAASACASIKDTGASQTASERMADLLSYRKAVSFKDELEDYSNPGHEESFAFFRDKLHLPRFGASSHGQHNGSSMFINLLHPHGPSKYADILDVGPNFPVPVFYSHPSDEPGTPGVGEHAAFPEPAADDMHVPY
ncbi:hypothetical protein B0H17DRAFT_1185048 [Mycena rosella]|uniref:C2 domain-containing protein n=1 Tax=Mycena rosella TaxID=1033263 RepID=A0AAD7CTG8_MYCRO|nr:hypothetical protein B0H17DRAFT_1185048 [Mycena rosella]